MKKIICLLLFLSIHLSLEAQTEKGRFLLNVSLGSFSYQSFEAGHIFSGSISPAGGYTIANNLLVGVGVPLSYFSQKNNSTTNNRTNVGLSPFARYYFGKAKLKPYLGFNYSLSFGSAQDKSLISTPVEINTKSTTTIITPSLGLAYFINRTVSIDGVLGYNWYNSKTTYDSRSNNMTNSNSQTIGLLIGLNVFFD